MNEGLKSKQVLTLHRFNELYRDQVLTDLRERLIKSWAGEVKVKHARLSKAEADDALLQNPDARTETELKTSPIKPHIGTQQVSPAVIIPLTLPEEARRLLEKSLLDATETVMTQLLAHWAEAFMGERKTDKLHTDFKVKRNDHSVRLVIAADDGTVTHEATICYVTVERGKPNTKTKAYDLVCLRTS